MYLRRSRPLPAQASACDQLVDSVLKSRSKSTNLVIYTLAIVAIATVGGRMEAWKLMATAWQDVEAHAWAAHKSWFVMSSMHPDDLASRACCVCAC